MRRPTCMKVLAVVAGLATVPLVRLQAQVGLWVQSGTAWGGTAQMASAGPVKLRWRWYGADAPTQVNWQLTTQAPASTVTATQPVSQAGSVGLPTKGGVDQLFTLTPIAAVQLPFYVRLQVQVAAKGDAAVKHVYSRWITVRAPIRATSSPVAPLSPATTEPARAAPTGSTEPLKTAGVAGDATPLRIRLARIHAMATARTDYEAAGPGAIGRLAPVNQIYAMMVSIELNRANLEQSLVRVKATPVYHVTTGATIQAHIPIWGPDDAARPIAGTGGDVLLMVALMQRYGSRSLGISEGLILKGIRAQLSLIKGIDAGEVKAVLLKTFAKENESAADQDRNDRPVPYNLWARPILLTTFSDNLLQRAREGEIIELTQNFGTATGLGSTGGRFTVVFDMRR